MLRFCGCYTDPHTLDPLGALSSDRTTEPGDPTIEPDQWHLNPTDGI
jgi:hypothetical protein